MSIFAESYLSDLRTNRPQRPTPTGTRPLSLHSPSASSSRFSLLRSATASMPPALSDNPLSPHSPPRISTPQPGEGTRRRSTLLRRASHKRTYTVGSLPSVLSFASGSSIEKDKDKDKDKGKDKAEPRAWDGTDMQDGRMGDTPPAETAGNDTPEPTGTFRRRSSMKRRESTPAIPSSSLRDFSKSIASAVSIKSPTRSQSVKSSGSSTGSGGSGGSGKKSVKWKLPKEDRAGEAVVSVMPPCHPLKPQDVPHVEQELSEHFSGLSTSSLPTVAPLRITKAATGRSTPVQDQKLPMVPERSATYPIPDGKPAGPRREYGAPLPTRRNVIDPWKNEPSQHNKVRYTSNKPAPLPSPPSSGGSDDSGEETEILKELGRRPLPKAGSGTPPSERKNNTKYGTQIQPPAPPAVAIVTTATPVQPVPSKTTSAPVVPTISFPDDDRPAITVTPSVPSISLPDDKPVPNINLPREKPVPSIVFPSDMPVPSISLPGDKPPPRPLPTKSASGPATAPNGTHRRPLPRPRPSSIYSNSTSASSLRARGPSASCNLCRTPIEGRIVTASSHRFHPECFRCAHCSTSLEHVGFYPEPADARRERLEDDPDAPVRFYCHLDFHELFSPRCKSCKTPIESEVVVACGATWHAGHFFCAECGDPFTGTDRFVEKDGYAWCVGCYQKRYSGRCKKCKKPVLETVVKALGGEWHEECFCCIECSAAFNDGRFFVRTEAGKEVPVCVRCEERRLKM